MCKWLPFHIDCTDLQVWYCLSIPFVIENVFCFVIIHEKFFTSKPKLFKISNLFIYRIIECTHYSWSFIYWIMKKLVIHQKAPSVLVWAVSWIVKEISLAVITKLPIFLPKSCILAKCEPSREREFFRQIKSRVHCCKKSHFEVTEAHSRWQIHFTSCHCPHCVYVSHQQL